VTCYASDRYALCDRCRSGRELECRRETPEALAVIAYREQLAEQRSYPWTVFDEECKRRRKGAMLFQSLVDVFKWSYPQHSWRGLYRDELTMSELHRYDERVFHLRGKPKPRSKDDVAKLLPGLKPGGGLHALFMKKRPLFALLGRA
jgi:hypothetical protein